MFERRLKIFLSILLVITGAMLLRAVQLQVFGREHWQTQAVESMKRPRLIETTRGTIFDAKGEPIAIDEACIDAAVDFRAISEPPDPDWLRNQAIARVRRDLGDSYWKVSVDDRKERIAKQTLAVKQDLTDMWRALAEELDPKNPKAALERIDDTRRGIIERVQMRRRYVWYQKYQDAVKDQKGVTAPWYSKWLLEDQGEGPDVDNYIEDVGEQEAAHPILHNITPETLIRLKKNRDRYPGLAFIDSADRQYPFGNAAAHVLGRLSKVMHQDILKDPNLGKNELREYQKNDLIGRMGLEALCEPVLRGTRGQVVRVAGEQTEISRTESIPGANVRTTLDIKLQREIESLFAKVTILNKKPNEPAYKETLEMHGAAVVIDVPTGAVRALASWPNYDANRFDELYADLSTDDINQPLLNRATQWAIEPGSTVKPVVGLGAITDGLLGADEGIECTGYLTIRGQTFKTRHRCWIARMYAASRGDEGIKHHQLPVPHRGHAGNPDGFLTFSDALERSCNVYFETVADKLGVAGLTKWFRAFGMGRPTGIGIAEARGWLPTAMGMNQRHILGDTWNAGIGQGQVGATTIQMANVAATVARDGVWVRPHLVDPNLATTRPAGLPQLDGPDRVDLKLSHAAILAAKKGMYDVVYADGGTATFDAIVRKDVRVAGKTGSAQAPPLRTPIRDARGNLTYECAKCQSPITHPEQKGCPVCAHEKRRIRRMVHEPRSPQNPNAPIPWYRGFGDDGTTLSHAWFIGYAPAENPQVAFAVMVEYGGSGGYAAAGVANSVIDACIRHGYLRPNVNVASAP
jgi:cell division protein FtsI/penicillin-binding protein 2